MASLNDANNWLNGRIGSALDFDGRYGCQCVDLFNYYYQYLTGRNPYSDGYGVPTASQLFDVKTPAGFTKVANNPANPSQLPPKGAIIIYDGALPGSGGAGHVEIVDSANTAGLTVWNQNWGGVQRVQHLYHVWPSGGGHVRGWLVFNGFTTPPPASTGSVTVVVDTLNVRTGPGTQYPGNQANTVDGQLHKGMVVPVAGTVAGGQYVINGKSSNLWHKSVRGNYFAAGGCQ